MVDKDGSFNDKIKTIRGLRAYLGLGLKEAKQLAETVQNKTSLTEVFDVTKFSSDAQRLEALTLISEGGINVVDNDADKRNELMDKLTELAANAVSFKQYDLAHEFIEILERHDI